MRKEEIAIPNERVDEGANGLERRPISPRVILSGIEKETPLNGPTLSQYLWVVKRHRWKLLGFVVFSVIATVIVSKRLTPLYESTAVIDIDRQTPAAVLGAESTTAVNSADVENYLTTQEQIVQSDAVLRPVVEKYHLLTPAMRKLANDKLLSSRLKDAPIKLPALKVTRPLHTFLLLISYRSPDPQLSADVVNEIARSYIRHTYDIRYQAASQMTGYMEKQLEELKAQMERSAAALANLEKDLDVINPEEKTNVFSARLLHLDNDLTAAEVDRAGKEAAYNAVKNGSLPAAEASEQGEQLRDLEAKLNQAEGQAFIITDGIFSMEGSLANLPAIVELAKRYGAVTIVDDSHGTGVMGRTGRGTIEHFGLEGEVDILTGTLGKALGGAAGGFVAGSAALVDTLVQRSRTQLFSNALPATVAASALRAIEILETHPELLAKQRENIAYFRAGLERLGFKPLPGPSAIVPIIVGETAAAIAMSDRLLREGVFVTGFGFPVVPEGTARIRVQLSAALERADLDRALAAFERVGIEVGAIESKRLTEGAPL